ncbi:helix-turn-helix domain-containing protein [Paraflavitalea sp. CAU 1676]|uniref:GlxA family transcriptional regulator n=1 Tax=Paraflavitalea sp. CAU 1676 TaxID=3032598 RepID=UPI0023DBD08A|nr:helix-turn-helix domain-containing protein [Paraflavitalea sp. CAU 1676]MDF2189861.1 helix-turn-helix domain-containing protein [Paraflavitalea sp. CAU 1676]
MKRVTILVPDGQTNLSSIACIVGSYEMFSVANAFWKQSGRQELYKIETAGVSNKIDFQKGMLSVHADTLINDIDKTNLIIVPSLEGTYQQAMNGNKPLVDWLARQYKQGAEIASMCSGTFMLADAGILDGKNCSTHWCYEENFKALFPRVNLQIEKLITDEHGIYTNGGAYSFLNLLIYLIEKFYDRTTAIFCSKMFQVELDRQSQSAFAIFTGQKLHGDEMVQKAQAYIESRIDEKLSVEDLSSRFAVGRRNFDRRFIKATGNTPVEYAQRVKIESAKKALETTRKTVNEVMYEVGYSDVKAFREVFKRFTGMSPLEYRNRYNKEALV